MPAFRRALPGALLFLLAWAFLNAAFNLRYPAPLEEPQPWYLLPSIDVVLLLVILAGIGWAGRYLPNWVLGVLSALVLWVRLFRFADPLIELSYYRRLNLSLDLPLLPELFRLIHSTVPWPRLILFYLLLVSGLGLCLMLVFASLWQAQRFLAAGHLQRGLFAGVVVLVAALSPLWPPDQFSELHKGLFGTSVLPSFLQQARLAAVGTNRRLIKAVDVQNARKAIEKMPAGLEGLGRRDVLFFLVESYGATALLKPEHFGRLGPRLETFNAKLAAKGWQTRSSWLDSPTYGGASWLAHATLATGVKIADALEYSVVRQSDPPALTMASVFQKAGWRTVLVQPGTTRPFPEGVVWGYTAKYYLSALDYRGPTFGWAPMPDQHAIDFLHRKEVLPAKQPLFIQYALVSSHAPWGEQPPYVEDWKSLGDGSIYHRLTPFRYGVGWTNIKDGSDAYVDSLIYDFTVLEHYITEMLDRDALIILMGDHQPPAVAAPDESATVPVHLVSKDPALLARFDQVGYVPGMIPGPTSEVPGMRTFLPMMLERLSGQD